VATATQLLEVLDQHLGLVGVDVHHPDQDPVLAVDEPGDRVQDLGQAGVSGLAEVVDAVGGVAAGDHGRGDRLLVGAERDDVVEVAGQVVRDHGREELGATAPVGPVVEDADHGRPLGEVRLQQRERGDDTFAVVGGEHRHPQHLLAANVVGVQPHHPDVRHRLPHAAQRGRPVDVEQFRDREPGGDVVLELQVVEALQVLVQHPPRVGVDEP
jgi:hypothetical protein